MNERQHVIQMIGRTILNASVLAGGSFADACRAKKHMQDAARQTDRLIDLDQLSKLRRAPRAPHPLQACGEDRHPRPTRQLLDRRSLVSVQPAPVHQHVPFITIWIALPGGHAP